MIETNKNNFFNNNIVERLVRQAGWNEKRKLDRNLITEQFKKEGYEILNNVVDFMEQFQGLVIVFENKRNGLKNDDISFDFEHATHLEVPEKIDKNYSKRIQKTLVLIGSAYRDHLVLLMSNDNCVYGGFDNFLCKIADSGFAAIEAIVLDKDFIEIA